MQYATWALTANFVVQLVLYLKTASSVLPAKAKPPGKNDSALVQPVNTESLLNH
ncbi:MAG: hypothetical protein Ta2A_17320 [Treponemataceae bacterium]|nr:MAG: hypothetical protein Ta2A_17320 [Treponemataceae bacterium]